MEEKIAKIKDWLGAGSINILGLPMSGKDTQGERLAEALGGKFLSSGNIVRAKEAESKHHTSNTGELTPSNLFLDWVLPYLEQPELADFPLVLSSIGRWKGEENRVLETAARAGHPIKAVVLLNISEADVEKRFEAAQALQDRGDRQDDKDLEVFHTRLKEFRDKTLPVLKHYRELNLLVPVNGDQIRDAVFEDLINQLYIKASQSKA